MAIYGDMHYRKPVSQTDLIMSGADGGIERLIGLTIEFERSYSENSHNQTGRLSATSIMMPGIEK